MNLFFIILLFLVEILLCGVFLIVMFEDVGNVFQLFNLLEDGDLKYLQFVTQLLGLNEQNSKYSVLRVLGFGMGGILLALQALIANRRAKAMQNTARAQLEANRNTEQGQRQERLKNAIEHLGNRSGSIRLGGAYELFDLAQDTKEWRQTVLDIFCAHVRARTGESKYQQYNPMKPSVEIQSLLNLLFRDNYEIFGGKYVDLKESWLKGADLGDAGLSNAVLTGVHLQGARLTSALLQGADLREARLQEADLQDAQLQGGDLQGARLQEADFQDARLQGANLQDVRLQGANLQDAGLQGAILPGAQFQGAVLQKAQFQGVGSRAADKKKLVKQSTQSPRRLFEDRIRSGIGAHTDLSEVVFEGGLEQENVEELVKELSPERAEELRLKLQPHIGQEKIFRPRSESGADCGTYTKRQAKRWIVEYRKAESKPGLWQTMVDYIRTKLRRN